MNRSIVRSLLFLVIIAFVAFPARAERLGKGRSLVLFGVGGHRGEFVYLGGGFRYESGEVGGDVGYYRFLSDQWTLGISGGYHVGGVKTDEKNPNGTPFATDKFETHSFTVRLGGDRYAFIDDNVALYAGPGVVFTRGRVKDELTVNPPAVGGGTSEGPNTTEVGLNGRIGMYARLRNGVALFGHIGQVLSHASGENSDGKLSWWSSTHEGSVGLAFDF